MTAVGITSGDERKADVAALSPIALAANMNTAGAAPGGVITATQAAGAAWAVTAPKDLALVSPALRSLVSALDDERSVAFSVTGDSTGVSDGQAVGDDPGERWPVRFAKLLAAAYPSYHVMSRLWDPANNRFAPWVTLQAQSAGREYVTCTNRSLRFVPAVAESTRLTSGNFDLRALVLPDAWAPGTGGDRVLVARYRVEDPVGTFISSALQLRWVLGQDGSMRVRWSTTGSSWTSDRISTAPVPGTPGTPLWVRVTVEINTSTGWTTRFWTSTDGVTWTQLGTTLTQGGAVSALFDTVAPFFEVGAAEWQPSANPFPGRIYEVQVRDGVDGPDITPRLPRLWQRYPNNATTFGGAPTLYLINSSVANSAMADHTDPLVIRRQNPNYGQRAAFINDGHNEIGATGQKLWTDPYTAWVTAIQGALPLASIVAVLQNPHTSAWVNEAAYGTEHITRTDQLAALATRQGWGLLDQRRAFRRDPRGVAALIQVDGLHPNGAGAALGAAAAARLAGITA